MMLALASASVCGMAQGEESADPTLKYSVATNSFWSNWFIQANGTWTAFYSNQEHGQGYDKSPIKDFRRDMGFSVAIGKWFTPGLGLRTKFNGIWGKAVFSEDCATNKRKYWDIQEQALFNLSNMFCGYNEKRVWNFIPYVGVGVTRNMSDDIYALSASAGILNTFRVSKRVAINLDLNFNLAGDEFDQEVQGSRTRGVAGHDRSFRAEVGVTYNIGKTGWSKTPDVDAIKALSQQQIDALNAQLSDAQDENGRLKKMLADEKAKNNRPAPKAETKLIGSPVSVFFNLGKSKIASKKDLQNVKDLAQTAKDNNTKLVVTGYADSKTGSADFNKKLSQKRAEAVADELVKMGVDRSNIEIKAEGGVDTLSPISYNRRATVTLK